MEQSAVWHCLLLYSLSAFKRTIERTDFSRFLCFRRFHDYVNISLYVSIIIHSFIHLYLLKNDNTTQGKAIRTKLDEKVT